VAAHLAPHLAADILILCLGFIQRLLHCLSERTETSSDPMDKNTLRLSADMRKFVPVSYHRGLFRKP
jgi:hypothetical protein